MTFASTGAERRLALDENSFQQLLAAAYTLQEHNEALQAKKPRHDLGKIFSEINNIRARVMLKEAGHDFPSAAALVADCLRKLTGAEGASICLVNDGFLSCVACSGTAAKVPGGSVASNSLVATERLRNGRAFQSPNARSDIRLEPALSLAVELGSLLALPIEQNNEIAGLVELRWRKPDAFEEWDERICELMVGLLGEALNHDSGPLNAAIPPTQQLAPGGDASAENLNPSAPKPEEAKQEIPSSPPSPIPHVEGDGSSVKCRVCGHPLPAKDDFCGHCGMLAAPSDDGLQSKWASMWFMQEAQKAVQSAPDRAQRLWPLEGANAQRVNQEGSTVPASLNGSPSDDVSNGEGDTEIQETDESSDLLAEVKRGPRSVLSVLKSRFKARAMGQ